MMEEVAREKTAVGVAAVEQLKRPLNTVAYTTNDSF
jgi:hypothetical protein